MELNQQINLKLSALVVIFYVLLAFLIKDHINLAYENDRAQREIKGIRLEIANGEYNRTIVKTRTVSVPYETIKEIYVPPEGKVIITPKDPNKKLEDVVNITVKRVGFTLQPGMQLTMLPYVGGGLDVKLVFINRFGAGLGLNYFHVSDNNYYISPTVNVTYRLDRIPYVRNSEALLGLAVYPTNRLYLGIRMGL